MDIPNLKELQGNDIRGKSVFDTKQKTGMASEKADFKENNSQAQYRTSKAVNKSEHAVGGAADYTTQ
jgi:hypothetical protein